MDPAVVVAIVVALAAAGIVAVRLRVMAKRNLPDDASTPLDVAASDAMHTADPRFRLLSFQGGSVPADLGPVLEELRRNGIEVDEETLRRKLADGVAGDGSNAPAPGERPGDRTSPAPRPSPAQPAEPYGRAGAGRTDDGDRGRRGRRAGRQPGAREDAGAGDAGAADARRRAGP